MAKIGEIENKKREMQERRTGLIAKLEKDMTLMAKLSHAKIDFQIILGQLFKGYVFVDTRDENENTLLHLAIQGQHFEAMKLLLARGADKTLANRENKTPLNYLKTEPNDPLVQWVQHGVRESEFLRRAEQKIKSYKSKKLDSPWHKATNNKDRFKERLDEYKVLIEALGQTKQGLDDELFVKKIEELAGKASRGATGSSKLHDALHELAKQYRKNPNFGAHPSEQSLMASNSGASELLALFVSTCVVDGVAYDDLRAQLAEKDQRLSEKDEVILSLKKKALVSDQQHEADQQLVSKYAQENAIIAKERDEVVRLNATLSTQVKTHESEISLLKEQLREQGEKYQAETQKQQGEIQKQRGEIQKQQAETQKLREEMDAKLQQLMIRISENEAKSKGLASPSDEVTKKESDLKLPELKPSVVPAMTQFGALGVQSSTGSPAESASIPLTTSNSGSTETTPPAGEESNKKTEFNN